MGDKTEARTNTVILKDKILRLNFVFIKVKDLNLKHTFTQCNIRLHAKYNLNDLRFCILKKKILVRAKMISCYFKRSILRLIIQMSIKEIWGTVIFKHELITTTKKVSISDLINFSLVEKNTLKACQTACSVITVQECAHMHQPTIKIRVKNNFLTIIFK